MAIADRVRDTVQPLLAARGLELYDIEQAGGQLKVVVERPGGVDLNTIGELTRAISHALDELDPIPGRYLLEVSSPGLERTLRTPAHFAGAVGASVRVKLTTGGALDGERRVSGELAGADADGFTLRVEDGTERTIPYGDVERARTVFEWGPPPRPGRPPGTKKTTKTKTAARTAATTKEPQ